MFDFNIYFSNTKRSFIMKRLLILLTAVMAVSAEKPFISERTFKVAALVDDARVSLKKAMTIQNESVAHHAASGSPAAYLDKSKNVRNDLSDALNATSKVKANHATRVQETPVNLVA